MARRNILKSPDPILRKISKPVVNFDQHLGELLDDLHETLLHADGLGLAAVQVGVLKRVYIVEIDDKRYEVVNPCLVSYSGKSVDNEGCLSVAECRGVVERPQNIVLEYFDRFGVKQTVTAENYTARAFLHELDHLDGILFIDKMQKRISND
ncbi:MAG: peptide deformylase [Clostridia bacterium]